MSRPLREPSSRNRRFSVRSAVLAGALVGLVVPPRTSKADEPPAAEAQEASPPARVEKDTEPVTPRVELRYDVWVDGAVIVGLAGAIGAWTLVQDDVLPNECRWCDGSSPGAVNAVDDFFRTWLRRPDTTPASTTSHVVAYGVAPLTALGLGAAAAISDRRSDEILVNDLLLVEAVAASIFTTEALKSVFLRERPYVHAIADPDEKRAALEQKDALVSFPSGHTTATFAMAAAGGTIATMRGYRLAPLVWVAGAMLGVATGYLRIAADRHYFTDVLGGAAVGTGIGIGVPVLFHRPRETASPVAQWMYNARIATSDVPGGRVVTLGWTF
jgi:membrane-associated phospholipid phosphatase